MARIKPQTAKTSSKTSRSMWSKPQRHVKVQVQVLDVETHEQAQDFAHAYTTVKSRIEAAGGSLLQTSASECESHSKLVEAPFPQREWTLGSIDGKPVTIQMYL